MDAIVLLGALNDRRGRLHAIAVERAEKAIEVYRSRAGAKVLPTGGCGWFNRTSTPHALHLQAYLVARGVPAADILPIIDARSTIDDTVLAREALAGETLERLMVVTSDFHLPRARWIFARVFGEEPRLEFVSAPSSLPRGMGLLIRVAEAAELARLRLLGVPSPSSGVAHGRK